MTKAVRLTISGFLRGQFTQCVTAWKYTPASTETDFASAVKAAQTFITEVASYWLGSLPVDYVGSSIRAKVFPTVLYTADGTNATVQVGFNGEVGTRTGTIATTSIAPLLIWPFEVAGKPRTGKTYMPGVTETDVNNNRLTDELQDALGALQVLLLNDISFDTTGTMRFSIYSPKDNEIYVPEGGYVSTQVGNIRARQRPHG
jgi:hypothetical protein